jgi:hypothetical protein
VLTVMRTPPHDVRERRESRAPVWTTERADNALPSASE